MVNIVAETLLENGSTIQMQDMEKALTLMHVKQPVGIMLNAKVSSTVQVTTFVHSGKRAH